MHVAIIMDGNRRWAKSKGLPSFAGHKKGSEVILNILPFFNKYKIYRVSVFALSVENFKQRTKEEINKNLRLLDLFMKPLLKQAEEHKIKVQFIGKIQEFPQHTRQGLKVIEEKTKSFGNLILDICLNYSGKQEILSAVNSLLKAGKKEISEQDVNANLSIKSNPDLLIRTGSKSRISNFLLWQLSYSEMYFSNKLWPQFDESDLKNAVEFYKNQIRNFGK